MKFLIFVSLVLLIIGFSIFIIAVIPKQERAKNFFEENNVIDTTPIGKDLEDNWIYRTIDNETIKTKDYPTTPKGIVYAKLTELLN